MSTLTSDLLTLDQLAVELQVKPNTLKRAVREGRLKATIELSSAFRRFTVADVLAQLKQTGGANKKK